MNNYLKQKTNKVMKSPMISLFQDKIVIVSSCKNWIFQFSKWISLNLAFLRPCDSPVIFRSQIKVFNSHCALSGTRSTQLDSTRFVWGRLGVAKQQQYSWFGDYTALAAPNKSTHYECEIRSRCAYRTCITCMERSSPLPKIYQEFRRLATF